MTDPFTCPSDDQIAAAFQSACEAELTALKPGNVHIFAGGHDMDVDHFRRAARAAAPHIADRTRTVGARIKSAVAASMEAAGCNTNLGIILLSVPLAETAQTCSKEQSPQDRLAQLIPALTQHDADDIYAAIRIANPGGLGHVETGDVTTDGPSLSLDQAMTLAAKYDRIANAYVTHFGDIFTHHLPALNRFLNDADTGITRTDINPAAITRLYMQILSDFPDSHIIRKFDRETANHVQHSAERLNSALNALKDPQIPSQIETELLAFDQSLKARRLNPGTTADFVVATIFAKLIFRRFDAHESTKDPCPRPSTGAI